MSQISTSTNSLSKKLLALYTISFLSGFSLGIFNPIISTFLEQNQVNDVLIGANSTVYFLFITLCTPLVAKLMYKIGIRHTIILGLIVLGTTAPLFPLIKSLPLWFITRAFMGIGASLFLVGGQTGLNQYCHDNNRTLVSGLYALAFSIGIVVGPITGFTLYKISPQLAFFFGSGIILCGVITAFIGLSNSFIVFQKKQAPSVKKLLKSLTLPLHGGFAYGFATATLVSLYPVFLLRQNYELGQISILISSFVLGSIISTIPITYIAQRHSKLKVIFVNSCTAIIALVVLSVVNVYTVKLVFSLIAGASIGSVFPLAIALVGEKLSTDELPSGSALFTGVYSFGSTMGPILSSIFMKYFGTQYVFGFTTLIFTALFLRLTIQEMKPSIFK